MNRTLETQLRRLGILRRVSRKYRPPFVSYAVGTLLALAPAAILYLVVRTGNDPNQLHPGGADYQPNYEMRSLLPPAGELGANPAFEKTDPSFYDAKRAFRFWKGREEVFLAYGLRYAAVASYHEIEYFRPADAAVQGDLKRFLPGSEIQVQLLKMAGPEAAFGVYSTDEMEPGAAPFDAGLGGYGKGLNLYFWQGPFYVKVLYPGLKPHRPEVGELMARLARKIASRIPSRETARGISAFPLEGLVPGTLAYRLDEPQGGPRPEPPKGAYVGRYRFEGAEGTATLRFEEDEREAGQAFRALVGKAGGGRQPDALRPDDSAEGRTADPEGKPYRAFRHKSAAGLLAGLPPARLAALEKTIRDRLDGKGIEAAGPAAPPGGGAEGLAAFLPIDSLPAGWSVSVATPYRPGGLFARIDGKEQLFIDYGYAEAVVADLKSGARTLEAWIFRMPSPERAFGIYSADGQDEAAEDPGVGDGGSALSSGVFFWRGPFFVKVQSAGAMKPEDAAAVRQAAAAVAKAVDGRLPRDPAARDSLSILPDGSLPRTARFFVKDELDRDFLKEFYEARYPDAGGAPFDLAVVRRPDEAAAREVFGKYAAYLLGGKARPPGDPDRLEGKDRDDRPFLLVRAGPVVACASGFTTKAAAEALLEKLPARPEGAPPRPAPPGAAAGLEGLLPAPADLPAGFAPGEPKRYKPGDLYARIDGREEIFIRYGYEQALVVPYAKAGLDGPLEVWIFRMKNPLHAFGIFSADAPEGEDAGAGERSAGAPPSAFFFRGPFYVKCQFLSNAPDRAGIYEAAKALAKGVDRRIGAEPPVPELSLFPEGAVRGTLKFFPKDELDRDFLKDFFTALYPEARPGEDKAAFEILLAPNGDEAAAQVTLGRFKIYFGGSGKIEREGTEGGGELLAGSDAEGLGFEVWRRGRFVLAASLFKDREGARKTLSDLAGRLPK